MKIQISEIKTHFADSNLISNHLGQDTTIERIRAVDDCRPGDLVFVERKEFVEKALSGKASGVVVPQSLVENFEGNEVGILVSENVRLAHAAIKQKFGDRDYSKEAFDSPRSAVHPTASIADSVFLGPNVVIGPNVVVGENSRLLAGVVVESGASIGSDTIIHPNAVIGYNCQIGNNVEIGATTVIGSEGFGFAQDQKRKSHRIPQTGIVVIEDEVRIGAGNCIDRAVYGQTKIGRGTKTDNICHIAHNVQVGEDCLLTAMFCCAGSTKIGNRVVTSGHTGILDHLEICDDVFLVHKAGVAKNVRQPGVYGGMPLQPIDEYMKNTVAAKKLASLTKTVRTLERKINELTKE